MPDIKETNIAYVINAWSGHRRHLHRKAITHREYYLTRHLARLAAIQHSLSRIIIMVPLHPHEPKTFTRYLREIECQLPIKTSITVRRCPNVATSYSSYTFAYEEFRDRYTHYFLIEDDYMPAMDHFDRAFIDIMNREKSSTEKGDRCGAVFCSNTAWEIPNMRPGVVVNFADISHGMVASEAMEKTNAAQRDSIYRKERFGIYDSIHQARWTASFWDAGYIVRDVLSKYRVKFSHLGKTIWYGDKSNPVIVEAMV